MGELLAVAVPAAVVLALGLALAHAAVRIEARARARRARARRRPAPRTAKRLHAAPVVARIYLPSARVPCPDGRACSSTDDVDEP